MSSVEARVEQAAALARATQERLSCGRELLRVRAELARAAAAPPPPTSAAAAAGGSNGQHGANAAPVAQLRGAAAHCALTSLFASVLTAQLHDAAPDSRGRRRALRRAAEGLKQLAPLALHWSEEEEPRGGGRAHASGAASFRDRRTLAALSAALQRVLAAGWAAEEDVAAAAVALAHLARATGGASDALALACALAQAGARALLPPEAAAALREASLVHASAEEEGAAARCCGAEAAAAAAAAAARLCFNTSGDAPPPDAALLPALAALVAATARLAVDGRCDARATLRRLAPAMQPPGSAPPPCAKRCRRVLRELERLRALRAHPSWPGATEAAAAASTALALLSGVSGAARCHIFARAPPAGDDAAATDASAQHMRNLLSELIDSGELARQLACGGAGVPTLRWALADARAQLQQQQWRGRRALHTPPPPEAPRAPALSWGRHERRGAQVSPDGLTFSKTGNGNDDDEEGPEFAAALARALPPGAAWRVRCTNAVTDGDGGTEAQGGMVVGLDDPLSFDVEGEGPLFGWLCGGGWSSPSASGLRFTPPDAGPHARAAACVAYGSGDALGFALPRARPGVLELTLNGAPAGSVAPLPPGRRLLPYACVHRVGQRWALEAPPPARAAPPPAPRAVAAAVDAAAAACAACAAAAAPAAPAAAPRPRLAARLAAELFAHATALAAVVSGCRDAADRPAAARAMDEEAEERSAMDASVRGGTAVLLALASAVKRSAAFGATSGAARAALFRAAAAATQAALAFVDAAALAAAQLREDAAQPHAVCRGAKLERAAAAAAVMAAHLTACVANAAACPCGDDVAPWLALQQSGGAACDDPAAAAAAARAWLERARAHPAATTPLAQALLRPGSAAAAVADDVALAAAAAAAGAIDIIDATATTADADAWLAALLVDVATAARAQPASAPTQLAAAAVLLRDARLSGSLPLVRCAALSQAPLPSPQLLADARAIARAADAAAAAAFERCAASAMRDGATGSEVAAAIIAGCTQVRPAGLAALGRVAPAALQALLSHAAAVGAHSPLACLSLDSSSSGDGVRCFADAHLGARAAAALAAQLHASATLRELDLQCSDLGDAGAAALAHALQQQQPQAALAVLHIGGNMIGAAGAAALAAALRVNMSLRELYAEDNYLGADGAAALREMLRVNTALAALDVSGNGIGAAGAAAISSALRVNGTLTALRLGGNAIGEEGATALGSALCDNTTLTALDLSENGIGPTGAASLATALSLHSLDLSGNAIGAAGAAALAQSLLRAGAALTHLNVARNVAGERGAAALFEALQHSATLTSLDVSGNRIGDGAAGDAAVAVLARSLRANATLMALDIGNTLIGDVPLAAVAEALRANSTLRTLIADCGPESDASAAAFAQTLRGNATLRTLRLSRMSRAGVEAMADALRENGALTTAPWYAARDWDGDSDAARQRVWRARARALVRALCACARSSSSSTQLRLGELALMLHGGTVARAAARALCAALRAGSAARTLSLESCGLGDDIAVALAEVLRADGCPLTIIDLSRNRIGPAGAAALASALAHNTRLATLILTYNLIGDDGARAFARALPDNVALEDLRLGGCGIGAEAAAELQAVVDAHETAELTLELAQGMPASDVALDAIAWRVARNALDALLARARGGDPALTALELGWSAVGDAGAAALAAALAANTHVRVLRLHKAAIGDAGAAALAGMLRTNTALTALTLSRNGIGCAGAHALADALAENGTLTALDLHGNGIRDAGMRALCAARQRRAAPLSLRLFHHTPGDGEGGRLKRGVRSAGLLTDAACALLSSALVGAPDAARAPADTFADGIGCTAAARVTAALVRATPTAASLLRQVQHAARLGSAAAVTILTALCDAGDDSSSSSSFDVADDERPALAAALAALVADGAHGAAAAAAALLALRLMHRAGAAPDQDALCNLFVALSPERMLDGDDTDDAASCVDMCALLPRREVAGMLSITDGTVAALRALATALEDASTAPPQARSWLPLLAPLGGQFDVSLSPDAAASVAAQLLRAGGGAEELLACAVAALLAAGTRTNDGDEEEEEALAAEERSALLAATLTGRLLQCVSELCADGGFAAKAAATPALMGLLLHASKGRPPAATDALLPALARAVAAASSAAPRSRAQLLAAEAARGAEYAWRAALRVLHAATSPPGISAYAFLHIALERTSDGDDAARALGAWRDALRSLVAREALALDLAACAAAMLAAAAAEAEAGGSSGGGDEAAAAAIANWVALQLCRGWPLPPGVLSFVVARMTAAVAALETAGAAPGSGDGTGGQQLLQPQLQRAAQLLLAAPSLPWGTPGCARVRRELLAAASRAAAAMEPPPNSDIGATAAAAAVARSSFAPAPYYVALVGAAAAAAPPLDAVAAPPAPAAAPLRVPSDDAFTRVRQLSELLSCFEARAPLPRWFVASLAPPPPASELQLAPGIYHCLPVAATAGMECILDAPYDAPLRLAALALPPGCAHTHVLVAGGDATSGVLQLAAVGRASAAFARRASAAASAAAAAAAVRDGDDGAFWYCAPGHAFGFAPEAHVQLAPRRGDARSHDGEERLSWPLAADDAAADDAAAAAVDPVAAEAAGGRCGHMQALSELRAASFRRYVYAFTPGAAGGAGGGCTPDEAAAWLAGAAGDNAHWSGELDAQLVRLARSKAPSKKALSRVQPGALFPSADGAAAAPAPATAEPEFGAAASARLPLPSEQQQEQEQEPAPHDAERSVAPPLAQRSGASLAARFAVLQRFNAVVAACIHWARPTDDVLAAAAADAGAAAAAAGDDDPFAPPPPPRAGAPLGARLLACKGRLFPHVAGGVLKKHLARARGIMAALPGATLDVGSATLAVASGNASLTLFEQLFAAMSAPAAAARNDGGAPPVPPLPLGAPQWALWAHAKPGERLWRASLGGLHASDAGGPFRDTLRAVAAELCRAPGEEGGIARCPLRLFARAPNADQQHASYTDAFLPRAGPLDEAAEARLRFVGALMGGCLVTCNPLELTLAPYIWKALLREERLTIHDLAAMDAATARRLALLRAAGTPDEWPADVTWAVRGAAGTLLPAAPGGLSRRVEFNERAQYCAAALAARRRELAPALAALRSGLEAVVPPAVLALLTWRALEARVAGAPDLSVAALRAATRSAVPPHEARYESWLWAILGAGTAADRRAFLAFATGRSRLPPAGSGQHALVLSVASQAPMDSYPRASTCSVAFHIAPASSLEAMRERLLYAIHNCNVIDADDARPGGRLFALADAAAGRPATAAAAAADDVAAAEERGVGGGDDDGTAAASAAATEATGAATRFVPLLAVTLPEEGESGSDSDGSDDDDDFCVGDCISDADVSTASEEEEEEEDDDGDAGGALEEQQESDDVGDDADRRAAPLPKARAETGPFLSFLQLRRSLARVSTVSAAADAARRAQVESYAVSIYKVLKQVHPGIGMSRNAMTLMCVFALRLPARACRCRRRARTIQCAVL
jgi:Ran GTPase-activating protein (RanGAP) involved in mRNA processing and transport